MRVEYFLRMTLILAALLCVGACGDDGEPPTRPSAAGAKAATGASGAKASVGGNNASAGGSSAGATAAPAPMPVACGSEMCTPPANPLGSLLGGAGSMLPAGLGSMLPAGLGAIIPGFGMAFACCLDTGKSQCGVAPARDGKCEPPSTPDERCPGLSIGALTGSGGGAPGCCIKNMCGQDGALFGRGCVENSELKQMLSSGGMGAFGNFITLPESRACDAPPPVDAGTADAGI